MHVSSETDYPLPQPLQLLDEVCYDAEPLVPERGIRCIQTEGRQQLAMPLGAAGLEHVEIFRGETFGRFLVNRIERIDQTIAEGIGVNVERRMDEMGDVGPEVAVAALRRDRGAQRLALGFEPDLP